MMLLLSALVLAAPAAWESDIDARGIRSAWTAGSLAAGTQETEATLRYKCAPGRRGNLIWSLEVPRAAELKAFDFRDFEGPDAPANGKRLSELALEGGLMQSRVATAQTGYFAAEPPDTFVIETSAPAGAAGELALLTDAIGAGTSSITWRVRGARDPDQVLLARFDGDGAAKALGEARIGCGPAPRLAAETVAAWVGKDPNAANVFDDPALLWRLRALLGRDFNTFRLAIADAQPVAREGAIVFVIGHLRGDEKVAAAWMYDVGSGASEAALVEDGKLRTIRDEDAPRIAPPEAVRAALSAAM
jgi:hypothetical protein